MGIITQRCLVIKSKLKISLLNACGIVIGLINAILGAGGGMLVVPVLKSKGLSQTEAHATAIAVILPITVVSCGIYLYRGQVPLGSNLWFLLFGAIGAIVGGIVLKKIPAKILKKIFGVFIIWAAVRMMFK